MLSRHEATAEGQAMLDRQIGIMDFLDGLAARSGLFVQLGRVSSHGFAPEYYDRFVEAFKAQLTEGVVCVNDILAQLGGMPVLFTNEVDGTEVKGKVVRCTGFDLDNNKWQMLLADDKTATLPGNPTMPVTFGPGELRQHYLRTLETTPEEPVV